jgi:hypothetical protein
MDGGAPGNAGFAKIRSKARGSLRSSTEDLHRPVRREPSKFAGLGCIPPLRPCFGTPPTRHSRGRYDFSKAVISSARGSPGAVDEVSSGLLTGLAFALVLGGATWLAVGLIEWAETR